MINETVFLCRITTTLTWNLLEQKRRRKRRSKMTWMIWTMKTKRMVCIYKLLNILLHKKFNDTFSENLGKVTVLALISIIYSNWHFNCSKCIWSVKSIMFQKLFWSFSVPVSQIFCKFSTFSLFGTKCQSYNEKLI